MKKQISVIFSAAVIGGLVAVGVQELFIKKTDVQATAEIIQPSRMVSTNASMNVLSATAVDFTTAAELTTSGVVHIKTYRNVQTRSSSSPFDEIFREFFGDQYYQQQAPQQPSQPQRAGSGSGVVLTADGYIATNNHVIDGADKVEVVLNDRRRYDAEVIGKDPTTDLALLKINEKELSFIEFGDSDGLKIGEWVLAVGNPFDLTSTVTAGIVSAKARNINILKGKSSMAIESFIQTDAAVNPGNSGGALVNLSGQLVGINSAIASPTGAYAGYSFAIPAALVKKVTNDLLKYGEVQRALLGVSIADVSAELAEEKGLTNVRGVYVAGVVDDGAAAEAGIKEGDVVIAINDQSVNTSSELLEVVARYRPGDEVKIKVLRDGKEKTMHTVLKNKLGTTEIVKKDSEAAVLVLGSKFKPLSDKEKKAFGIPSGVQLIELGDGKFRNAGIKKDFIIISIDRKQVQTPTDIVDIMNNKRGGLLIEGMYPGGERAYYAIGW